MEVLDDNQRLDSVANVTTDREARLKFWYVAQVRSCCEKKIASKINALGIETFVPTQTEIRQWSDRKKKIEKILLPMLVLFKGSIEEANSIKNLPSVYSLLKSPGHREPAVIPNEQIERFKFMVGNCDSKITIETNVFDKGDAVKIIRGKLKGLEGFVKISSDGKSKVTIIIDYLGCASIELQPSDIELVG